MIYENITYNTSWTRKMYRFIVKIYIKFRENTYKKVETLFLGLSFYFESSVIIGIRIIMNCMMKTLLYSCFKLDYQFDVVTTNQTYVLWILIFMLACLDYYCIKLGVHGINRRTIYYRQEKFSNEIPKWESVKVRTAWMT